MLQQGTLQFCSKVLSKVLSQSFVKHIFVPDCKSLGRCQKIQIFENPPSRVIATSCALLILLAGFPGAAVLDLFRARNRAWAGRVFWNMNAHKKRDWKSCPLVVHLFCSTLFGWYRQNFKSSTIYTPLFVLEKLTSTSQTYPHTHTPRRI